MTEPTYQASEWRCLRNSGVFSDRAVQNKRLGPIGWQVADEFEREWIGSVISRRLGANVLRPLDDHVVCQLLGLRRVRRFAMRLRQAQDPGREIQVAAERLGPKDVGKRTRLAQVEYQGGNV